MPSWDIDIYVYTRHVEGAIWQNPRDQFLHILVFQMFGKAYTPVESLQGLLARTSSEETD